MNDYPREPTADECTKRTLIDSSEYHFAVACWYPQMGGYAGKAIIVFSKGDNPDPCFDCYVWHDGEWPFHNGESPCRLHHCDANQFVEFGGRVLDMFEEYLGISNET